MIAARQKNVQRFVFNALQWIAKESNERAKELQYQGGELPRQQQQQEEQQRFD